jgi:outer membrane protein assembly factor BamB
VLLNVARRSHWLTSSQWHRSSIALGLKMKETKLTQEYETESVQDQRPRGVMDLIFTGFNSQVLALDRETGEIVWTWEAPQGSSPHVSLLLDGDRLIASVIGYTYCLDPVDGRMLWMNPLKGFGVGTAALVSMYGNTGSVAAAAIIAQQQQQSASSNGVT